ncbi:hypothetical protein KCP77_05440 [Salmonella enterica subsp. enterica]|nr:hypothetical protein KCP77_05440 [Salmonella enterica subsp. enterica]
MVLRHQSGTRRIPAFRLRIPRTVLKSYSFLAGFTDRLCWKPEEAKNYWISVSKLVVTDRRYKRLR